MIYTYNRMRIVWDVTKAAINIRNHGDEFSHAATVLDDPMAVTLEDRRHGEQRFVTVGSDLLGLAEKSFSAGCSKMPRCKAPEILRSEAYLAVRRNNEG